MLYQQSDNPNPALVLKAREHAGQAQQDWRAAGSESDHPWILTTLALARTVDEGRGQNPEEKTKRFLEAARHYYQAIHVEPANWKFHNNLGWVLLKLAEWGVSSLQAEDGIPAALAGDPAETAERYLRQTLEIHSTKLAHANLCLLYATPRYRADREPSLERCRFHGRRAIEIDPSYVNGNRDLCVSLLRFGEMEEAFGYFTRALELARSQAKDRQIIDTVVAVLKEMKIGELEIERWRHPDRKLLELG